MTDEKIIGLAKLIHDRTVAGTLKWEETAAQGVFQANLSKFVIRTSETNSLLTQGELDYDISIVNTDGAVVESFDDVQLSKLLKEVGPQLNGYTIMAEIFKNARRSALGVDKALDEIISELTALPPF